MKLYRYLQYRYWMDVVRKGFAAQRASAYEDIFEGVGQFGRYMRIAPTFYDQIYSMVCFNIVKVSDPSVEDILYMIDE